MLPTTNNEIRNRIKLCVAAYAYEVENESIMPDAEFDALAKKINKDKRTGKPRLDLFFRLHFDPSTGVWIRLHPELDKIRFLYERYYKKNG
jgi:hypothetical protein